MTRWVSKWRGVLEPPDSLQAALQACDEDSFPKALLRVECTMPVISVETERSNSALKLRKTKNRSTMKQGRLTNLSILKIHYGKQINISAAVDTLLLQTRVGCALSRLLAVGRYRISRTPEITYVDLVDASPHDPM